MRTELQNRAWACLPEDFKKEVKNLWELDELPLHPDYDTDSVAEGAAYVLLELFGHHNLTAGEVTEQSDGTKLTPIPSNTVVHTHTEAEAKELLQMLHENGYEWYHKYSPIPNPNLQEVKYINIYNSMHGCSKVITYCDEETYVDRFLTLSEFKERFVEEEKPTEEVNEDNFIESLSWGTTGKDTEVSDNFTKQDDMETKELNLCEMLKGHEGETFYSPICGEIEINQIIELDNGQLIVEAQAINPHKDGGYSVVGFDAQGKYNEHGQCTLYPSRALYERYPLDAKKAWSEWREAQKKFGLDIKIESYFEGKFGWEDCDDDVSCLHFRTTSDRDKCIEEIKSVIEKYSK